MPSRAQIVEAALGVKVPKQYERFLNKYGIYRAFGIEVFGIDDSLLNYDGIPCVIGATKKARNEDNYPHRFLVLHYTGFRRRVHLLGYGKRKDLCTQRMLWQSQGCRFIR